MASFLENNGVRMYSIGTETHQLFRTRTVNEYPNSFHAELQTIVNDVREVYSGLVTYDMHYGLFRFPDPTFYYLWDDLDLDVIGISGYIEKLMPELPTEVLDVATLEVPFENIFRNELLPAQRANSGRPIIFLEGSFTNSIGAPYESHHTGSGTDSDEDGDGINDGQQTQANLFQAWFNVMNRYKKNVKGLFIWHRGIWSDEVYEFTLSSNDITLSTRGLLADEVVRETYGAWKAEDEDQIFDSSFERCIELTKNKSN